jgi:hypothetical protein
MFIHVGSFSVAETSPHRPEPGCRVSLSALASETSETSETKTCPTAETSETSETSTDCHAAHGRDPSLPSARLPGGRPCVAAGLIRPAPGRRTDRRPCDASTVGRRILWPGTSRSRSAHLPAHASCSSFRQKGAEHRAPGRASGHIWKTARTAVTERKALIFRALKHVFARAVCLTCHRASYISRAPLGAYCGRSSVG